MLKTRNKTIELNQEITLIGMVPDNTPELKFTIGDRVALMQGEPDTWERGCITGIHLVVRNGREPYWKYYIHFDSPDRTKDWFDEDQITHEDEIPQD